MVRRGLRRVISTPMLALYGIGNIVGAGVYVLIGKIAEPAGYLSIVAFLLAALVAFCAALSYAELASRFPVSAGVAVYLYEAFHSRKLATAVGLMLVASGAVSTATLLRGFAGYFYTLWPAPQPVVVALVMAILLFIALRGIRESVGLASLLTLVEVGGLLFLLASIIFSHPEIFVTFTQHFAQSLGTINGAVVAGVISSSFIAFYAFVGFEDVVNVAEEVREPKKAFPRAILASMVVVTLLYVAVAIATLGVLQPSVLGKSQAPLADAYFAATGNMVGLITLASLIATLNGVIVNIIMGSRFLYGLARRKWIHGWFGKISYRDVPARSLLVMGIVALLCAWWLPLEWLAGTTSLLLLCVFFAVNVSLIVIRQRTKLAHELRISPHFLPWLGAATGLALLLGQLYIVARAL